MSRLILSTLLTAIIIVPSLPAATYGPGPMAGLQEPGLEGELEVKYASQYIRRGVEFNPESVLQPSLCFGDRGLQIEAWGNYDLTDSNGDEGRFTEWRYRVGVGRKSRDATVALLYTYYDYKTGDRSKTQEVSFESEWGHPFLVGINIYWDVDRADGFYFNSSTGYILEAGPVSITPRVRIGYATGNYNYYYFEKDEDTFVDFQASLDLELEITDWISLTGRGLYYELVRSNIRELAEQTRRGDNFWGEAALSLHF